MVYFHFGSMTQYYTQLKKILLLRLEIVVYFTGFGSNVDIELLLFSIKLYLLRMAILQLFVSSLCGQLHNLKNQCTLTQNMLQQITKKVSLRTLNLSVSHRAIKNRITATLYSIIKKKPSLPFQFGKFPRIFPSVMLVSQIFHSVFQNGILAITLKRTSKSRLLMGIVLFKCQLFFINQISIVKHSDFAAEIIFRRFFSLFENWSFLNMNKL